MDSFSSHNFFPNPHPPNGFEQTQKNQHPPFNDGSLGSRNDEERRETRYVMWIAGLSESSNLWTQMAAPAFMAGAYLVQTRLPKANCTRIDHGRCYFASLQEFKCGFRPSSIQATRRGTKTTAACRASRSVAFYKTHALELNSGKRTRRI